MMGCAHSPRSGPPTDAGLPLSLVPEMERIPEIDACDAVSPNHYLPETARCLDLWQRQRHGLEARITPSVVQSLSRWATAQMQSYRSVPPLSRAAFQCLGMNRNSHRLVYESVLDTLPTHQVLVTRWLKLFLIYDRERAQISQVIVTIRGQRLE